jgi:hypothetical protein
MNIRSIAKLVLLTRYNTSGIFNSFRGFHLLLNSCNRVPNIRSVKMGSCSELQPLKRVPMYEEIGLKNCLPTNVCFVSNVLLKIWYLT